MFIDAEAELAVAQERLARARQDVAHARLLRTQPRSPLALFDRAVVRLSEGAARRQAERALAD